MRHLLTLDGMTPAELDQLFTQALALKRARAAGTMAAPVLAGKTVALLFDKPSLRTRVSFEVAIRELGGNALYLSPQEVGLGTRESVADVARVLSSYVHAVVIRTFQHETVEEFARYASVPVINGLTDAHHPCQGLTDVFTVAEHFGTAAGCTLAYVGDGNNVAHSLLQACALAGIHVRLATPAGYEPDSQIQAAARQEAARTGATLKLLHDPLEAATGAHVLCTDVWTSMGQESEAECRRAIFAPYQLGTRLLAVAASNAIVMHPLPAHRGEEIADDVFDGPQSQVFVQAENRLHVQKAILWALLAADARYSLSA